MQGMEGLIVDFGSMQSEAGKPCLNANLRQLIKLRQWLPRARAMKSLLLSCLL
jgi:hypothetical protein